MKIVKITISMGVFVDEIAFDELGQQCAEFDQGLDVLSESITRDLMWDSVEVEPVTTWPERAPGFGDIRREKYAVEYFYYGLVGKNGKIRRVFAPGEIIRLPVKRQPKPRDPRRDVDIFSDE